MKIEQIWLNVNGHVQIFTIDEDIPADKEYRIVKIIFEDGSIATW